MNSSLFVKTVLLTLGICIIISLASKQHASALQSKKPLNQFSHQLAGILQLPLENASLIGDTILT